jgi:hypothetical protein
MQVGHQPAQSTITRLLPRLQNENKKQKLLHFTHKACKRPPPPPQHLEHDTVLFELTEAALVQHVVPALHHVHMELNSWTQTVKMGDETAFATAMLDK